MYRHSDACFTTDELETKRENQLFDNWLRIETGEIRVLFRRNHRVESAFQLRADWKPRRGEIRDEIGVAALSRARMRASNVSLQKWK